MAIAALTITGPGLAHLMDPEIAHRANISHGAALSILIPSIMEFKAKSAPTRFAKMAELMGDDVGKLTEAEAAGRATERIKNIIRVLNIKSTLKDVGIPSDDIGIISNVIHKAIERPLNILEPGIGKEDIYQILYMAK